MSSYEVLAEAVIKGDVDSVESEVNRSLNEGADPQEIIVEGLIGWAS